MVMDELTVSGPTTCLLERQTNKSYRQRVRPVDDAEVNFNRLVPDKYIYAYSNDERERLGILANG